MSHLIIDGGKKLKGSLTTHSAKNSAVAILCASLMVKGKVKLVDMPEIEEVNRICELLESIGVKIIRKKNEIILDSTQDLKMDEIDKKACEVTRSSLLLLGALAGREKKYKLYKSGGCNLGSRTVRPHLFALEKLGVSVELKTNYYTVETKKLKGREVVMYESGDTTTENAIMTAVLASGVTVLKMASSNYMVQDLCYFLIKAGAKIEGVGNTTLKITGVKSLKPVDEYPIMPDPIVAMTLLSVAITTKSHLTVKNCPLDFLELELTKLEVLGQKYEIKNQRKSKNGKFNVVDIEIFPSELTALSDKIYGRPFPGLNIDNLPLFVPILTQAKGRTLVHDWVYEKRSVYYLELQKLGAKIKLLDPHRVWVEGPVKFIANEVISPASLRPAVNVLICMLAAKGKSILRNTYMIERGYENLYEMLNKVGADIKIIK